MSTKQRREKERERERSSNKDDTSLDSLHPVTDVNDDGSAVTNTEF